MVIAANYRNVRTIPTPSKDPIHFDELGLRPFYLFRFQVRAGNFLIEISNFFYFFFYSPIADPE